MSTAIDDPGPAGTDAPPGPERPRGVDRLTPPSVRAAIEGRGVETLLAEAGVRTVHLGLVDASGTLREKRLGPAAAARALEQGWSFIDAIQWWGPDDTLSERFGAASWPATVEPDSGRPYPFGKDGVLFLAEFGEPLRELSPRYQLQRMIELADAIDVEARVGWEFECIVLNPASGARDTVEPAMTSNRCWSSLTMAAQEEELGALVGTLEAGAVPIDHVCAELGPGCLEVATAPEPPLRSADSAALAKLYTKAHFARSGRQATFMAQLGAGFPGLGGHPSMSLHGVSDGAPLLCDEPGVLSKIGSWAVGGIVALLPELLAMAAPYPNSFRRFGPGNWAPSTATWGPDAYSCALRVVDREPSTARLELRVPGADTSPHHCLAMLLGAAMWGIEERLDPPQPVIPPVDGRSSGACALPRNLTEAADRFASSTAARELFGPAFVAHFAASRQAEVAACHRFVSSEERERYLDQV
jgi:glutamine synthetase